VRGCFVDVPKALQESVMETVQQKFYSSYCNSISLQTGEATRSVGRSHSGEEIPVMGMERRASVIQSQYFETTQKENDDKRNDKVIAD
jgi:hypothetical protein